MVELPTGGALRRLRKGLIASDTHLDAEAAESWRLVRQAATTAYLEVIQMLGAHGLQATGRTKTREVLAQKLRRMGGQQVLNVDDLAGVRIVVAGSRVQQDEVVSVVQRIFGQEVRDTKDMRDKPSHGYRAVHVLLTRGAIRVEVQVRTMAQDAWAQTSEAMAELLGRGIRYGQPPTAPSSLSLEKRQEWESFALHILADASRGLNMTESTIAECETLLKRVDRAFRLRHGFRRYIRGRAHRSTLNARITRVRKAQDELLDLMAQTRSMVRHARRASA